VQPRIEEPSPAPAEPAPPKSQTTAGTQEFSITDHHVDLPPMEDLTKCEAELYLWNPLDNAGAGEFTNHGVFVVALARQPKSKFQFWLTASTETGTHLAHPVVPDMNHRFSTKMRTFTWNHISADGHARSWCLRFGDDVYPLFNGLFTQCYWESVNHLEWNKAKVRNPSRWILPLLIWGSGRRAALHSKRQ
jgi:hypothetical protein